MSFLSDFWSFLRPWLEVQRFLSIVDGNWIRQDQWNTVGTYIFRKTDAWDKDLRKIFDIQDVTAHLRQIYVNYDVDINIDDRLFFDWIQHKILDIYLAYDEEAQPHHKKIIVRNINTWNLQ